MFPGRRCRILVTTATVAIGAPLTAAWWVAHRTEAVAAHLAKAGEVPVRIGAIDADLTGTVRIVDVAFGDLIHADAIEASVAMSSLISGQLGADEIRVDAPHIAVHVDADGDSDLARLARRLAHATAKPAPTAGKPGAHIRRIVVGGGRLTAQIAGIGELSADNVELVPDAGGVRVVTGPVRLRGVAGAVHVELEFQRSAAELALPRARFGRVLAVAGSGSLTTGNRSLILRDLAAGRLQPDGALELRAAVDDAGASRPLGVALQLAHGVAPQDLTLTVTGDHVPLQVLATLAPHGVGLADARASGTLTVRRTATTVELAIDGAVDGAQVDHRLIAPGAVAVSMALRGQVTISPTSILVRDAAIRMDALRVTASGWLRRGSPVSGQLDLQLAQASCPLLLAALPAELRGPLDAMAMTGELGGHARLAIDLAAPLGEGVELSADLANTCHVTDEPPAADVTALAGVAAQTYADGTQARVGRGTAGWAELPKLPGHVGGAFVSAEDGRFREHHGFDLEQIARSLEIDLREHRLARGGSTISQQLIKNTFLSQRRSLDRKLQEAVLTWRLEDRLTKGQILERYLNVIELGPHVFGIGAAARYWFDERPRNLTIHQAAFLAALTSEPTTMSRRIRRAGGLDPDSAARVDTILRAMRRDGVINGAELDEAHDAPLHFAATALSVER